MSYTDLPFGPATTVEVTSGGTVMVILNAGIFSSPDTCHMGFEMTGTNNAGASDSRSLATISNDLSRGSATYVLTGLNAGLTTFTAKYRSDGGFICDFVDRSLTVIPY
jgi:hypothetical protein